MRSVVKEWNFVHREAYPGALLLSHNVNAAFHPVMFNLYFDFAKISRVIH